MVAGSQIEGGSGTHNLSAGVRKTIQSIKEIVGNHSDADIYVALKETNMDPNETAQKLLNQDPFHEVKRKRDKKKEGSTLKGSVPTEPRKPTEVVAQRMKSNTHLDRNPRKGGYGRNNAPGVTREFRVVRDNRISQNVQREIKPPVHSSVTVSATEPPISNVPEKSSAVSSKSLKSPVGHSLSQSPNVSNDSHYKQAKVVNSSGSELNDRSGGRRPMVSNVAPPVQSTKPHDSHRSSIVSPNSSAVGVYSSSSDPVHIPSLASRPAASVGAIKREVGAVGVRRYTAENSAKSSIVQGGSVPNPQLGRDGSSREQSRSLPAISKSDQLTQSNVPEPVPSISVGRSFLNNHYNSRPHQQLTAHQKAPQANKEWKPKSSQKPSSNGPGIIGTPTKSASSPPNSSKDLTSETAQPQDKLPHEDHEDQNVIIAAHIRVSETDRCRLTFGSLGIEGDSSQNSGLQEIGHAEEAHVEPLASLPVSAPESLSDEPTGSKQAESLDGRVPSSGSISPASGAESEPQPTDRRESSSPQNMDSYANIGLGRHSSPPFAPLELHPQQHQQQQGAPELPSFSQAYDSQTGYDIAYFRPASDDSLRGQVLQISQEGFTSHVPATTIPMVQQQQTQVPQMYPQVHLSHFTNLMPYHRQFISPVYVPPMVMPGYSNNPTYSPHPSSGSSYLLMPGANSPHLTPNGLKYGIQQYKSVPAGSPTGFGSFTSPTGYAINAPGVVGSASGLDDSSRLKYKDGNLYVPNPQAETSELWMNPRDIPNVQSASYYNMTGQTAHAAAAAAYLPSHTSYNAAAQSSHMQFPGLYHPSQATNPHHMGGNVGVGVAAAAPGTQVGPYHQQQPPQLGQLSWTGNF